MDPVSNPYAPGAGRPPAALVGRDAQLDRWRIAVDRIEASRTSQSLVLYGLRGVGKTVLLTRFFAVTRDRSWIAAQVEAAAGKSLREALGEALHAPLADLARPSAGKRLLKGLKTAVSFKASYDLGGTWNFGIDLTETAGGGADTGVFETDLGKLARDLAEAAREESVGLAILIDEAQDLSPEELTAVCSVAHTAGQQGWPCLFALAGLPSLPRVLAEAKSYAERLFAFERIEHLDRHLAEKALIDPAAQEGVCWDDDAVSFATQEASGYPYFLQQFGQESWNEAPERTITLADARVGVARGRADLDAGFYRARWDRATPTEKRYLREMAADGEAGSSSGDIASRLGRSASSTGPMRASLIAKGLIFAPEHGIVSFTVPGMADFIQRQPI
ncbi:ATP-binding protein [Mycolicibacter sp. MYC123]|uniref:ATP-binding protein n=1 Tax=[Mycobacterium] zoologicum TaxID=2872311 RepID=A0ABU5YGJ9_9MYCO|nr:MULTISPECIES: ATP-binding protein [unclassified Mycolicibacter]MEB3048990.1 ATP-binding protein [Mycolicibacter sp. MYC123]MEB3065414.1 ATP-binding protein [Mycolicibacter sp. MYC101]